MPNPIKLGANRWRSHSRPMETAYLQKAKAMQLRLDRHSTSLCLAKWLHVSLHLTTGRTHSCYHPPTHAIPLKEISKDPSALHNTSYKKKQRADMLRGVRPPECQYCWGIEDTPGSHVSDRSYRSAEPWASPHFEKVIEAGADQNINPRAVEVNFSSACQLKCSYCSPHLSSTWMEEVKKFGGFELKGGVHNDLKHFSSSGLIPISRSEANPYAEAFWKWWPDLYPDLSVFRMTGGEPLMDVNTFKVLDYILEHPKPDLTLAITSNFSVRQEYMEKFLPRISRLTNGRFIQEFQLYVSCDSQGAQAEYIRFGLDYNRFIENLDRYLEEVTMGTVTFIVTFNLLSVVGWSRLLKDILMLRSRHSRYSQRVFFDTPLLRDPKWQSLPVLPEIYQSYLVEAIETMKNQRASLETMESRLHRVLDFETGRMERNLAWMRARPFDEMTLREQRNNFFRFFTEHDRRRGTDFLKTFPEMEDFWQICRES